MLCVAFQLDSFDMYLLTRFYYIDEPGVEFRDLIASASLVLGLKV